MIKKLVRYGNSQAIVLDRAILELLGIQEGGEVKLSIQDGALVIKPVVAVVEEKPVLKEPEIVAEMRKVREGYAQNIREAGDTVRTILLCNSANSALIEQLEGARDGQAAVKILGEFTLQSYPELKKKMMLLVGNFMGSMARLANASTTANQGELESWYKQDHDRIQEHLQELKAKQEYVYEAIEKVSREGFSGHRSLEGLLTPEVMELIVSSIMNQLQAEAIIGKIN